MSGILYIVATPIGNLEDVTLRAVKIYSDVDIILAEDTRVTKKLLDFLNSKFQIPNPKLISYHQHSGESKKVEILNYLLQGKNLALVTDAGTPGISDPGNELIDYLLKYDSKIRIVPVPGASAITAALSVCGFNINKFVFIGFMSKKKKRKLFEWIKTGKISFAFYESPKRIIKTLNELKEIFGERRVYVGRELTKIYESSYRGNFDEVINAVSASMLKGEIVIVVE